MNHIIPDPITSTEKFNLTRTFCEDYKHSSWPIIVSPITSLVNAIAHTIIFSIKVVSCILALSVRWICPVSEDFHFRSIFVHFRFAIKNIVHVITLSLTILVDFEEASTIVKQSWKPEVPPPPPMRKPPPPPPLPPPGKENKAVFQIKKVSFGTSRSASREESNNFGSGLISQITEKAKQRPEWKGTPLKKSRSFDSVINPLFGSLRHHEKIQERRQYIQSLDYRRSEESSWSDSDDDIVFSDEIDESLLTSDPHSTNKNDHIGGQNKMKPILSNKNQKRQRKKKKGSKENSFGSIRSFFEDSSKRDQK